MRKLAILIGIILIINMGFIIMPSEKITATETRTNVKGYTISDTIKIGNNSELISMAFSEGWSGDGSSTNPFIISGFEISGVGPGIYIGNTNLYLIIKDCYVHNHTWQDWISRGIGIEIFNSTNIIIENNRIESCYNGGILIDSSDNVTLISNDCKDVDICIENANYNHLLGNYCSGGSIFLDNSEYNIVKANIVKNFLSTGISISKSNYLILDDNDLSIGPIQGFVSSRSGIKIWSSNHNTLINNYIRYTQFDQNQFSGILIDTSINNRGL